MDSFGAIPLLFGPLPWSARASPQSSVTVESQVKRVLVRAAFDAGRAIPPSKSRQFSRRPIRQSSTKVRNALGFRPLKDASVLRWNDDDARGIPTDITGCHTVTLSLEVDSTHTADRMAINPPQHYRHWHFGGYRSATCDGGLPVVEQERVVQHYVAPGVRVFPVPIEHDEHCETDEIGGHHAREPVRPIGPQGREIAMRMYAFPQRQSEQEAAQREEPCNAGVAVFQQPGNLERPEGCRLPDMLLKMQREYGQTGDAAQSVEPGDAVPVTCNRFCQSSSQRSIILAQRGRGFRSHSIPFRPSANNSIE